MKILVISHAYVERANHKKLEVLSALPGLKLGVIYPRKWRTWHGEDKQQLTMDNGQLTYKEYALDTFFSGDGGKYFYNSIQLIISTVRFKPDIIYVEEEPFSFVSCQLSVVSWLLRIKTAFFTWENLDSPLGTLRSLIEKFTFNAAFKAVAGNREAGDRLKKRGFLKPVEVIPQFGVDTQVFFKKETPLVQRSLLSKDQIVIGFVGRPTLDKGLDVLMKAVSKITFDCRLLIVTSTKEIPSEILDLAKSLAIEQKVIYETSMPHLNLPKYFNQMDVFVLPSRTTKTWKEQFGRTLLEAMACGVPVVGSSSGAIPEVIGDAGLIFEEGNSNDLCDKLSRLHNEKIRKEFGEAGNKRVLDKYTYRTLCGNLVNFLTR